MTDPYSQPDLIAALDHVRAGLLETVQQMTPQQFTQPIGQGWAAEGYLKHLLLSVKPMVKGLNLPPEQLSQMFGQHEGDSKAYHELVALYQAAIAQGVRAEDYQPVTPVAYRMPEGIPDEQTYLAQTWDETHQRLFQAIGHWSEADLDRYQLPHPALGAITLRETLFFTLHHNTLHWHDIQGGL
jgi:hypothetical protein